MSGCDVVRHEEIEDDYDHELREWEERVELLYEDSLIEMGGEEQDISDEVVVKRLLKKSFANRMREFLHDFRDLSLAWLDCDMAFAEAQEQERDRVCLLISENGREWLRQHRGELTDFLQGGYESNVKRLLGRE